MPIALIDLDNTLVNRVQALSNWSLRLLREFNCSLELVMQIELIDDDGMRPREQFCDLVAELKAPTAVVQTFPDAVEWALNKF